MLVLGQCCSDEIFGVEKQVTRKRLALNVLFLVPGKVGGAEYAARNLITALAETIPHVEVLIYCDRSSRKSWKNLPSHWRIIPAVYPAGSKLGRLLYEQLVLPWSAWMKSCGALHSLAYLGPVFGPVPHIVTVHDANWLDHPHDFPWLERLLRGLLQRGTLLNAKRILTSSTFSRERLLHHLPHLARRLEVAQLLFSSRWVKLLSNRPGAKTGDRYILCVSAFYPHKRIPYLLDLWSELRKALPDYHLILVGEIGRDRSAVLKRAGEREHVLHHSDVTAKRLAELYQHAACVIQPSVYEGFGYPVYEAILAGAPVIVGNRECYDPSIREKLPQLSFDVPTDAELVAKIVRDPTNSDMLYQPRTTAEAYCDLYMKYL